MDGERTQDKTGLHLGSWTIRNRNHYRRRIQNRHRHTSTHTTIQRLSYAQRQHLPQSRRLPQAKQDENETPEDYWRKLVSLEKNCDIKDIRQEDK